MEDDIRSRFYRLRTIPFPKLGKNVGDFVLYDALLAGAISSFLAGGKIDPEAIPIPDLETEATLKALEKKGDLSPKEAEFRDYASLLAGLRADMVKAITRR